MNILFHGNCQGWAISKFFNFSESAYKFNVRAFQIHELELGIKNIEQERELLDWADIIFSHHYEGRKPALGFPREFIEGRKGLTIIPMSVHFNSGYFLSCTDYKPNRKGWEIVFDYAKKHGIEQAVIFAVYEANLGYECRWNTNFLRMKEKEINEKVPKSMRLSPIIEKLSRKERQNITHNHPTSVVLYDWSNMLLKYLGLKPLKKSFRKECLNNTNISCLPCEDWICTGAKNYLGLSYGGSEYENERCKELIRNLLEKCNLDGGK